MNPLCSAAQEEKDTQRHRAALRILVYIVSLHPSKSVHGTAGSISLLGRESSSGHLPQMQNIGRWSVGGGEKAAAQQGHAGVHPAV